MEANSGESEQLAIYPWFTPSLLRVRYNEDTPYIPKNAHPRLFAEELQNSVGFAILDSRELLW